MSTEAANWAALQHRGRPYIMWSLCASVTRRREKLLRRGQLLPVAQVIAHNGKCANRLTEPAGIPQVCSLPLVDVFGADCINAYPKEAAPGWRMLSRVMTAPADVTPLAGHLGTGSGHVLVYGSTVVRTHKGQPSVG